MQTGGAWRRRWGHAMALHYGSSAIEAVMPYSWEGGVALAMRHRLQWFIRLQIQGLTRELMYHLPRKAT